MAEAEYITAKELPSFIAVSKEMAPIVQIAYQVNWDVIPIRLKNKITAYRDASCIWERGVAAQLFMRYIKEEYPKRKDYVLMPYSYQMIPPCWHTDPKSGLNKNEDAMKAIELATRASGDAIDVASWRKHGQIELQVKTWTRVARAGMLIPFVEGTDYDLRDVVLPWEK